MPVFVVTVWDVLQIAVVVLVLLAAAAIMLPQWFRQWRCKHDGGVRETMACDAICDKCSANLGFIGTWREKQRGPQDSEGSDRG